MAGHRAILPDSDQDVAATWDKLMAEKLAKTPEPERLAQNGTNLAGGKTVTN